MASKTLIILEDDLDGGQADETVSFSLDGVSYEIDLSSSNATKLRDSLGTYVPAARRIGGRASRARSSAAKAAPGSGSTAEIREWARAKGLEVSERGRIPGTIADQYNAAHKK